MNQHISSDLSSLYSYLKRCVIEQSGILDRTPDEASRPTETEETCAICLSEIGDDAVGVSTLSCSHKFHATCLVPHLQRDPRCPCCRTLPPGYIHPENLYDEAISWHTDSDMEGGEEEGITVPQAIKIAKTKAKNDKRICKQISTIQRWQKEKKEASERMRTLSATLAPLEDKVEAKVKAYTDKTWAQFDTKNEKLILDLKASRVAVKRARTNLWQAKMRLAEKGGYERRPWVHRDTLEDQP